MFSDRYGYTGTSLPFSTVGEEAAGAGAGARVRMVVWVLYRLWVVAVSSRSGDLHFEQRIVRHPSRASALLVCW